MINFSDKENINNLIELEKISLMSTLDIQKNLNKQILVFAKNFINNVKFSHDISPTDKTFLYFNESTEHLNKSNSNINVLNTLLDSLDNIDISSENLDEIIKNYNSNLIENMNSIYENTEKIEKFVHKITLTDLSESSNSLDNIILETDSNNFDNLAITNKSDSNLSNTPVNTSQIYFFIKNISDITTNTSYDFDTTPDYIDDNVDSVIDTTTDDINDNVDFVIDTTSDDINDSVDFVTLTIPDDVTDNVDFAIDTTTNDTSENVVPVVDANANTNAIPVTDTTTSNVDVDENSVTDILPNENSFTTFMENTLVISETQKKVIFPFYIKVVKEILKSSGQKYSSEQDVIDTLYTKPISYYKFASLARFKEAYKLVKEREKGSRLKALGLAFELLGNYSLHPAIITSCDSLDELDIYLACLEDNTLEDFHFFNIKYEIPLAISKLEKLTYNQLNNLKRRTP